MQCTLILKINLCTSRYFEHLSDINVYNFQVIILHYEYTTLRKSMFSHYFELSITTVETDSNILRPANVSFLKVGN